MKSFAWRRMVSMVIKSDCSCSASIRPALRYRGPNCAAALRGPIFRRRPQLAPFFCSTNGDEVRLVFSHECLHRLDRRADRACRSHDLVARWYDIAIGGDALLISLWMSAFFASCAAGTSFSARAVQATQLSICRFARRRLARFPHRSNATPHPRRKDGCRRPARRHSRR